MDWRNHNTLWASVLVETWVRLGLRYGVLSPGSRSAPLALALAAHPGLEVMVAVDERCGGFLALGLAKRTGLPVVLVATSGTAGGHFLPAVMEAAESGQPLLLLTADRPPWLRQCRAGQTLDQTKLYGSFAQVFLELAMPDPRRLDYLRQTAAWAWERCRYPQPGVVHLNVPLDEPLDPVPTGLVCPQGFAEEDFWAHLHPPQATGVDPPRLPDWQGTGILVAGWDEPRDVGAYCRGVLGLSRRYGLPLLADALSPLRHTPESQAITTYDWFLRDPKRVPRPDFVVQVGDLPTSKVLRQWLTGIPRWIIDPRPLNRDPLHGPAQHLRGDVGLLGGEESLEPLPLGPWHQLEQAWAGYRERLLAGIPGLSASQVPWLLAQGLPPRTQVVVANSLAVREVEWFWPATDKQFRFFCNRGGNGIDGTLSTAMGICHQGPPTVLLTGDLAFLHDSNALLLQPQGSLTIVLINNQGGGIFRMLPIARTLAGDPLLERVVITPQRVCFPQLAAAYGISYQRVEGRKDFLEQLREWPPGVRILEVASDQQAEAQWRQELFWRCSQPDFHP
ncbi:MAG: 2-succinyl-5-enolpyruvyl-6-hydroxy-3-cyclohexene-1-carboxylic-acid synthase [Thermostichales cyanobacterium HHBFW_bins_127]